MSCSLDLPSKSSAARLTSWMRCRSSKRTRLHIGRRTTAAALGVDDEPLFETLRAVRKHLADTQGVPPYIIFGDATLVQMAQQKPLDDEALLAINGVGRHKLEKYGSHFLDAIAGHCA